MTFLDRETCEKLMKMWCTPMSGAYWANVKGKEILVASDFFEIDIDECFVCYAFCLEDFVGTDEVARKNGKIIWSESYICSSCAKPLTAECSQPTKQHSHTISAQYFHRHAIIDSPDWREYIKKSLEDLK